MHHRKPFHFHPELELDSTNLVTLCESKTHNCHLIYGHGLNWKYENPNVDADAAYCLSMLTRIRGSA